MTKHKKYDLRHIEEKTGSNGIEFEKFRFEYAWRHFDIHCRQRLQMFYFFLFSAAFLCGALATAETNQKTDVAQLSTAIPIVGITISVIFFFLDCRNRALYSISCRHLEAIERNVLFPEGFREIFENLNEPSDRVKGILIEDAIGRSRFLRHKYLIPLCHVGGILLFLFLLLRIVKVV
jgi:hypothetical protein